MSLKNIFLFIFLPLVIILSGVGYKVFVQPQSLTEELIIDDISSIQVAPQQGELQFEDLVVGTGKEAKLGDTVSVHYTGTFLDGKTFDSSVEKGVPFEFTLGEGRVIQGWELGFVGMKVGGQRRLLIPPHLGYGEAGNASIPPNTPLIFDVELLEIK